MPDMVLDTFYTFFNNLHGAGEVPCTPSFANEGASVQGIRGIRLGECGSQLCTRSHKACLAPERPA